MTMAKSLSWSTSFEYIQLKSITPTPASQPKALTCSENMVLTSSKYSFDMVAIYFSAHWCGPCRGFTPLLSKVYSEVKAAGKAFEIVFVSADRDEKSMASYFAEMPWLALQWADKKNLEEDLDKKCDA